jgi:hypothetical protein
MWTTIMQYIKIYWLEISYSATISESEQLPEDGKVRPKYIASDVILILF